MAESVATYFRDQLRSARANALRDAEGYLDLLYCIERLGSLYWNRKDRAARKGKGKGKGSLGDYKDDLVTLATRSPLARCLPKKFPECHVAFDSLYDSVKTARNDALHQGAVARHLTRHAVELALILEDSLMTQEIAVAAPTIGAFMVRNPVCASLWHPVSFLRQVMLSEAFSYLPVNCENAEDGEGPRWRLVSDYDLAQYLCNSESREEDLATTLQAAIKSEKISPALAKLCKVTDPIKAVINKSERSPVLVVTDKGELLGIVTPFDLM